MHQADTRYSTPDPMQLDPEAESGLERVPGCFLADLLSGAKDVGDPSQRDYGERYVFVRVLGEGGQGVVVSARDNLLGREVAIKALKAPFEPAREEQLEREAKICGILEHPNILPTYDLCRDETGSPFLVMKQIEGVSLEELLRDTHAGAEGRSNRQEKEFSRRRLINIFLQVCHAMEYAHSRGVYHLDLKPQNIKLGPFGEVYVLDWGFAAREEDDHKYIAGTPIYIAPERLKGERPDTASDIYSLGVILYRILTGRLPREVGKLSFSEYRQRIDELPVVRPRLRDRNIPSDLEAIVLKAMADGPQERYRSAKLLAGDLERFLDILPVSAYREGAFGRLWKLVRRQKRMAVALSMVAIALLIAGGMFWHSHATSQHALALQRETDALRARQRLRARARNPLEKAVMLVEQRRAAVEKENTRRGKSAILEPAFKLFRQAIDTDPEYAEPYYQRGKAYYLATDTSRALADFQKAVDLDASYIMSYYYAGRIYTDGRQHEKARQQFERMNAFDPMNEYSELGRAFIDLDRGRYGEALERCKRVAGMAGRDLSDIWYIRGVVYQRSAEHRDLKDARQAYDRFLAERQDTPSAFLNRGDVRLDQGDVDGAIADYRSALAVNPSYRWALNNLGYVLYEHKGQPEDGLALIEKAIKAYPDYVWGYMSKGAICEHLKRYDEAESAYETAHALAPASADIWYREGLFFFRQERFDEAEQALSQAIARTRDVAAAKRRCERAFYCRGIVRMARALATGQLDLADAVRDFEESIRLRSEARVYPALMRWLALKLSKGEPVDPGDFGRQVVAPPDKPWLAALGSVYLGEATEAEVLDLAKTPKAACEAHFYLGAHAHAQGDLVRARMHYEAVLKTGVHLYMEYILARVLLRTLGKEAEAKKPAG